MTDKSKLQTTFLPRLEKENKRASGFLIPPVEERTSEREEAARQLVREDILAATGAVKIPKFCFIDPQKAASFDLRSGQVLQHCSEEQVKQFNESPLPRLGQSFLLKSPDKAENVVRIPTQPADLQVFLNNGDEEQQYLGEMVDLEALVQEVLSLEANALLIPLSQEGRDEDKTADAKIQFDAGGYERSRENNISREKSADAIRSYTRTQAGWGRNRTEEERLRQAKEEKQQSAEPHRNGRTRHTGGIRAPSVAIEKHIAGGEPITSNWDEGEFGNSSFGGIWQKGTTSRGIGVSEFTGTDKGVGYNANAHIAGSAARFDAKTNSDGPASGLASGSILSYAAEADGNIVLGKELAANGQLGAELNVVEISGKGKVKITPRRAWHNMSCGLETAVKAPFVLVGLASLPECEEEEGLDEGYGLVMEGGLSGQIGLGAQAGGRLDLGGNGRFGVGAKAKATFIFGGGGNFYVGFGQ